MANLQRIHQISRRSVNGGLWESHKTDKHIDDRYMGKQANRLSDVRQEDNKTDTQTNKMTDKRENGETD